MAFNSNLIGQVEQALTRVLRTGDNLQSNPEASSAIIDVLRKLRIARELGDRYYIAVTGSQSAGKTRLIRELYKLDKGWLRDDQGRGERVPVFIIEDEATKVPYGAVQTVENGKIVEKRLDEEAFIKLTTSWNETPCHLLPKLYVPRTFFNGNNVGFVLLPGYEIENAQNSAWQQLMRHTLTMSLGTILVTDPVRLAENSQTVILKDLASSYLAARKPVIVVSKTEAMDAPKRAEIADRVADVFDVPTDERNRIICSGVDDAEYVAAWSKQLIGALNGYAMNATDSVEARIKDMLSLLDSDLPMVQSTLNDAILSHDVTASAGERQRAEIVEIFNEAVKKYRRSYEKELRKQIGNYAAQARKQADDRYTKEEVGISNKLRHAKEILQLRSGEREKEHVERILDCWNGLHHEVGQPRNAREANYRVLSALSGKQLGIKTSTDVDAKRGKELTAALGYDADISPLSALADENVTAELRSLLGVRRKEDKQEIGVPQDRKAFERVVPLIPAVTMEFIRISQGMLLATAGQQYATVDDAAKETGKLLEVAEFNDSMKGVLRTVACILAVDVAVDGSIDTIPALFNAIFGVAAPAGVGATLSLVASGVVAGGFLAYRAVKEIHLYDAAKRGYISTVIDQLATRHVDEQLDVFDQVMESILERMQHALGSAYRLDVSLGYKDTLLRALAALERARLNLMSDLRDRQVLV
jgi:hypothetical protein